MLLSFIIFCVIFLLIFGTITKGNKIRKLERGKSSEWLPLNFPPNIELRKIKYRNWALEFRSDQWAAYPCKESEVVEIVNWAMKHDCKVRPFGSRHNWSPLTIGNDDTDRIILLSTKNLNKIKIISNIYGDSSFWAEPGILMEDLLQYLENAGLCLLSVPAIGGITLGGVLAINGHGSGVTDHHDGLMKGHTQGSLSNLILRLTAVVYDTNINMYALKEFNRFDPESGAFLCHLGRALITSYVIRAGPLLFFQCLSRTDIAAEELFAISGENTFSNILDNCSHAEINYLPFVKYPWIITWQECANKPEGSRMVTSPYNFPFTCFPPILQYLITKCKRIQKRKVVRLIAQTSYIWYSVGLILTRSKDIWGSARNTFLYVKPNTNRLTSNGYVVITSRKSIQRVIAEFYQYYDRLVHDFKRRNIFPVNGNVHIRVTSLDHSKDSLVKNASTAAFSALRPIQDRPELNVAIFFNILTVPKTTGCDQFYMLMEDFFLKTFNSNWSTVRVEWSKGWAYDTSGAWSDSVIVRNLMDASRFGDWRREAAVLCDKDPCNVFESRLVKTLFQGDM